jgi:hypothetical protein
MKTSFSKLLTCLVLGITLTFVAANYIVLFLTISMFRHGYVQEDVYGKAMTFSHLEKKPEIVFVGSSRTLNHINSVEFESNGIKAYNFGVAGSRLGDFGYPLKLAQKQATKLTVLSIAVEDLFEQPPCAKFQSLIAVIFNAMSNDVCLTKEIFGNLSREFYFGAIVQLRSGIYSIGDAHFLDDNLRKKMETDFNLDAAHFPRKIANTRGTEDRLVTIFDNGDGAIFQHHAHPPSYTVLDRSGETFNASAIELLREFCTGPRTVLVIEPSIGKRVAISKNLAAASGCKVIFNNQLMFFEDEIADDFHLNINGNTKYTAILRSEISGLIMQ